ncbi:MAG: hypothetical protein WD988_04865 [Candidatus Curtissbacteria bacterium]
MTERQSGPDKRRERDSYLELIAKAAKRLYFGSNEIRSTASTATETISRTHRKNLKTNLNKVLAGGGQVIIVDFPFPLNEDGARIQVVSSNSYLMQVPAIGLLTRDYRHGRDMSLHLSEPVYKNVEGALSLSVFADYQEHQEHIHTTTWNESESSKRRFAVITRDGKQNWRVAIDFRLTTEPGDPIWKINPLFLLKSSPF